MICPKCGRDSLRCGEPDCGYYERGDVWMSSHHDLDTKAALLENVQERLPELWSELKTTGCYENSMKLLFRGASVYHIPKITYNYKPIYSRKTCPKCRNKKTHYLKKLKKLLCLECGAAWSVKILRKKKVQCPRRVIQIPLAVYKARGNRFSRIIGDREQRDGLRV